jgi:hypothetical protein
LLFRVIVPDKSSAADIADIDTTAVVMGRI